MECQWCSRHRMAYLDCFFLSISLIVFWGISAIPILLYNFPVEDVKPEMETETSIETVSLYA